MRSSPYSDQIATHWSYLISTFWEPLCLHLLPNLFFIYLFVISGCSKSVDSPVNTYLNENLKTEYFRLITLFDYTCFYYLRSTIFRDIYLANDFSRGKKVVVSYPKLRLPEYLDTFEFGSTSIQNHSSPHTSIMK